MAFPLTAVLAIGLSLLGATGAAATGAAAQDASGPPPQPSPTPPSRPDAMDLSLSPECRVPGSKLYTLASLRRVKRALRERRTIKVLAIGSSSTAGTAAASSAATYPARLEDELEKLVPNVNVDVVNRGISGEIAGDAADRLKETIAEVAPDLVVWQVGTNDALARVDPESFSASLDETITWLQSHKIDVVLVDPQYTASLAGDDAYGRIVQMIEDAARKNRVPLVRRFEATRYMAARKEGTTLSREQFQLNDLGYRCMAEHVARAVTVGLLQPEPLLPPADARTSEPPKPPSPAE